MFFRSTLVAHKTARKPYFMGLVVHKEIISRTSETLVNTGLQGFLFTQFQAFGADLVFVLLKSAP